MKMSKKYVAAALRMVADRIEQEKCSMTQDEIEELYRDIIDREVDRTEGARMLGMSVANFDRLRRTDPTFPPYKKLQSGKPLWSSYALKNYAHNKSQS